jgi:NADPH:quinone reductase-like Zn-dependent oxidoreductase/acyl carrier protein
MYTLGLLSDEAIENGFSGPTLGLEFAGIVSAVGAGVTDFRPGDKVVGFGPSSFSTRLITGSETLAHLPGDISFEAAATIPTAFFTVYYALKHLARLQPGERVLIHGAAGGVGLAAIQVARLLGADIVATVGSQSKRDMLRLLGVSAIYDSRSHTFGEDILADTQGEGVDVVLNSLAGEAINQNLRVLRPFGRFLELGKRDFYENTAIGLRPFRNNISYFGIDSDQLMKLQPKLTRTLFLEMMALFEQGELYPLPYTAFSASHVVEAFRYMQQAKQIGKVVVSYPQLPAVETKQKDTKPKDTSQQPATNLQLPADKTFLVTGGLGGLGLRTSQWLVEKGARHLALLSRRGRAEGEAVEIIDQLVTQGVSVQAYACDVSDREQLAATLALIEQEQPALGGVVHAATVYADALVQHITDEQIEQVVATKAFGAHHLHELTADRPLELFVLFSSVTTLFGNPGQANYVGANLALEALTQLRRSQGLPATCVRWGAIDDAGYLARNSHIKQALQSRMGGNALTSKRALAVLEQMLLNDQPLLGVMEFDWPVLARFLPNAGAARYQLIARSQQGSDHDNSGGGDLLAELRQMEPEAQMARVIDELKHSLSQILMLPADQIDADQSLYDLGFDSLMGVELITDIEERFCVLLPAMAISESPSITKLTAKLLDRIGDGAEATDSSTTALTTAQVAAQHGVSEEEVKNT